jgi:hypothetical protein
LKKYKSPGSDKIPAELVQTRGETLVSVINKEELADQWKESAVSLHQFTRRVLKVKWWAGHVTQMVEKRSTCGYCEERQRKRDH